MIARVTDGRRDWTPRGGRIARGSRPLRQILPVRTLALACVLSVCRVPAVASAVTPAGNELHVGVDAIAAGDDPAPAALNQVVWVAGIVGNHTVPPDVTSQPILVLDALNAYNQVRHLVSLTVDVRGTAADTEFEAWELVADDNSSGTIDGSDRLLATAAPISGRVQFDGIDCTLLPFQQQRLLVAYSGSTTGAHDGSTIDAAVTSAKSFGFEESDRTMSTGTFELNAVGVDVFDGCIVDQVGGLPVASRYLGGGEVDVLTLALRVPANGWDTDELEALTVEIVPRATSAVFGVDLDAVRLWAEKDPGLEPATFDPGRDVLVASLFPGASPLRFSGLSESVPLGGRVFYVTVDLVQLPTDGTTLEMRLPANGIEVRSSNDGPLDGMVSGTAVHRISRSQLLSSVGTSTNEVSVGQAVDVAILVENRSPAPLTDIVLRQLDIVPPRPGSLVSGPFPDSLVLAPGARDTFVCQFQFNVPGTVRVRAVAGLPDSSVVGPVATSDPIAVMHAPTALALDPLSNLPGSVYRGQPSIVPLVYRIAHADTDSLAAPLLVQQVGFRFEDGGGSLQNVSAAFDRFTVRAGTQILATFDPAPNQGIVQSNLDPPLELQPGEQRDLSIVGSVAIDAVATSFRVRIVDVSAVQAVDANSGASVTVQAVLPWSSTVAAVRSLAQGADVSFTPTLPPAVNSGQDNAPIGQLQFSVPGAPGTSEARLTQLALSVRRPDGSKPPLDRIFRLFVVSSGSTVLLETATFDTSACRVIMPLTIAKTVTSGAPETIDLGFDLQSDAPLDSFRVVLPSAADVIVVDAISGAEVPVQLAAPDTFPVDFGASRVQMPAGPASLTAVSRTPTTAPAGAVDIGVADMWLVHGAPMGSASLDLTRFSLRTLDGTGSPLVPRQALVGIRLLADGVVIANLQSLPDVGSTIQLDPSAALRIAASDSVPLRIVADLVPPPAPGWLRFAIDIGAVELHDANEATHVITPTGTIPFVTDLLQVLAPPTAAGLGVASEPRANAARGGRNADILTIRLTHTGATGQSIVSMEALAIRVLDLHGDPLTATDVLTGARLRTDDGTAFDATLAADNLEFQLTGFAPLDPGTSRDLVLDLDVQATPTVEDLRLALDTGSLRATGEGAPLAVIASGGTELPYVSRSIHLAPAALGESFANFPNPFAAGREDTRITFNLAADAQVTLDIYTLSGERVIRLLQAAPLAAGLHDEVRWDGRNGAGNIVRNGTYLLRLVVDGPAGGKFLRKLAVLR